MSIDELPADPEDLEKVRAFLEAMDEKVTPYQEQILAKVLHLYNQGYKLQVVIPKDRHPYFTAVIMTDQERSSYG